MLKRITLAVLTTTALAAGAAHAADLPSRVAPAPMLPLPPAFTWSGFYVGTYSALISAENKITTQGNAANTIGNVATGRRPAAIDDDRTGRLSGAQIGYNLQFGMFVAGVEADIALANVTPKSVYVSPLADVSYFRSDIDAFGTVRGRLGVALDNVLIYATGGLAGADITDRVAFFRNTDRAFQFVGKKSGVEYGYTVGGGVEIALPASLQQYAFVGRLLGATAVSIKAEYLYYDLGDRNVVVNNIPGVGVNSYTSNFERTGHIGKIGFNYRFGTM
ncbi:MAG TPA: porin family protein [Beijerinckiaceae bacterium]|jgi:outer membrane immunogenic protein